MTEKEKQEYVPIKPLAEWLAGYATPPGWKPVPATLILMRDLWEKWLREFAGGQDAEMQ